MTRDRIRGWLIILGLALIATCSSTCHSRSPAIVFGALGLLFIVLMWYFGYSWYRDNLTAHLADARSPAKRPLRRCRSA